MGLSGASDNRLYTRKSWSARRAFFWVRICAAAALTLVSFLLAATRKVDAQEKPLQIGVLALGPRYIPHWRCGDKDYQPTLAQPQQDTKPHYVVGLLDQLKKLGYVEAQSQKDQKSERHFVLTFRTGTPTELREYARQFASDGTDIIVGVATAAVEIARQETRQNQVPILMTGVSDPVADGFVQSLARPGGYITGVSHQLVQGSGRRVELFKEMIPNLKRLLTIRKENYGPSDKSMAEIRAVADRLGIEVIDRKTSSRQEISELMSTISPDVTDGIMVLPDSTVIANVDLLIETGLARHIPVFGIFDYMAAWGAIASDGPSAYQAGVRIAWYVDKITKGAKASDLPVEPIDPEFVVNLKAAKCLGISLPYDILSQADRVIR
jgi:putative tryptophan/tyrosine transport system substrate-binding protein